MRKYIDQAKKEILKGILKKKPTPLAKVCGKDSAHNNALNELLNEKKVEIYSEQITITKEERNLEYYRWVPFFDRGSTVQLTPLLIKLI